MVSVVGPMENILVPNRYDEAPTKAFARMSRGRRFLNWI